jgi:hypothetical protein
MPNYLAQRLTLFDADDVTPLLGSVDGSGEVTDPTFSTDPAHARPFLEFSEDTGDSEVDFIEGASTIGQVNVTVLDKRQTPTDQSTGIFTWLQASGITGNTQVLRRRVLWEGLRSDGITWDKLINGVLYHSQLNEDLVSYTLALRDIRERERAVRVFVKNNDAIADATTGAITVTDGTCVFPRVGPLNGWGKPTEYDDVTGRVVFTPGGRPLLVAVEGMKGRWSYDPLGIGGGSRVLFDQADPDNYALILRDTKLKDILQKYGQSSFDGQERIKQPGIDNGSVYGGTYIAFDKYSYKNVIAQWSTTRDGSSGWNTLKIMPASSGALQYRNNVFEIAQVQPLATWFPFSKIKGLDDFSITAPDNAAPPVDFVKSAILIPSAGDVTPADGDIIYVRYISNLEPEEDVPKYLEEASFGRLLERVYDGDFSDPQVPPKILYDAAAMDAFKASTPPLVGIVRGVVDDLRGWVQEHIYKPLGAAPTLNLNGEIVPRLYALPDAGVPLLVLNDANVEKAGWEHGEDNAINKVSFTYQRDSVPARFGLTFGSEIISHDVIVEDWNVGSLGLFNEKTLEYKPDTAHSVLLLGGPFQMVPNVTNEVGWRLAMARAADVLTRFGQGAPLCAVTAMASSPGVADAVAGDWAVLSLSWLPDYATRKRGCLRLMQIVRVQKTSPISRDLLLVDAGAYTDAMTCPTVNNIQQYSDGRVSVDVTAIPADTIARLEFAIGATQPPDTSGAWLLMGRTNATGTFYTTPQAPGTKVWVRWRGEAPGRQPSTWCGVLSITMSDVAQMVDAQIQIGSTGIPRVSWVALSSTLGVRILYERHANGTGVPTVLTQTLDVDVNSNGANGVGYVDLPITLDPLEQVTVQVIGYPGFGGGAVSGMAGYASSYLTAQYIGAPYGPPTILPATSVPNPPGDTGSATLKVDSTNPAETIGVQVLDDAGVAWTLVTSDVDSTPLLVAPGTVIASTAWFYDGTTFAQILDGVALTVGVVRTFYAQATAQSNFISSGWVPFSWQGAEAPVLDERTIQLPFGNGATMGAVGDFLVVSTGWPATVLRWKMRAIKGDKTQVATDATFSVKKILEAGGSLVDMVGGTIGMSGGVSESNGSASGWSDPDLLENDEVVVTLESLTNTNGATSILVTLTVEKTG